MKIRENCYMLGLGSTGGKIYKEFVQRHYKGAAANGSEQDHKALGDVPNKYILQGFDGFGGHRERAMDCLAGNEDFIKFVEGIKEDIVFILFAGRRFYWIRLCANCCRNAPGRKRRRG